MQEDEPKENIVARRFVSAPNEHNVSENEILEQAFAQRKERFQRLGKIAFILSNTQKMTYAWDKENVSKLKLGNVFEALKVSLNLSPAHIRLRIAGTLYSMEDREVYLKNIPCFFRNAFHVIEHFTQVTFEHSAKDGCYPFSWKELENPTLSDVFVALQGDLGYDPSVVLLKIGENTYDEGHRLLRLFRVDGFYTEHQSYGIELIEQKTVVEKEPKRKKRRFFPRVSKVFQERK